MMMRKRQIHDGIAGGLITLGVLLGVYVNPSWLWLPGILGVTLLQSGFTGFCPVYYIIGSNLPREEVQLTSHNRTLVETRP